MKRHIISTIYEFFFYILASSLFKPYPRQRIHFLLFLNRNIWRKIFKKTLKNNYGRNNETTQKNCILLH